MKEQRVALYRKYRPENLDSVVSQEHIVKILRNALLENKISHAYLFSGPRGTGKTSVARILAKSLNCESRSGYNPCNKCNTCKSIKLGATMDVIEIDAASNRGIDEIRELREKIKFSPTEGQYKIFIIDEVHMLTKEAFNALLKTLEEPPSHAFFVLATTELSKVPSTIISRCQRHDFRRIKLNDISNKLAEISKKENIKITEEGINLIAQASEGGLRDALSILDQLASSGAKNIDADEIIELIGIASHQKVYDFINSLIENDTKKSLVIINGLERSNSDLIVFTKSVQDFVSKCIMVKVGSGDQIEGTKEQLELINEVAKKWDIEGFINLSEQIILAQKSFRTGVEPNFVLSVLCLNLTNQNENVSEPAVSEPTKKKEEPKLANEEKKGKTIKGSDKRTNGQWHHFLMEVKTKNNTLHAFLRVANPVFDETTLTLNFPYKFHKEKMEEIKNKKIVEEIVSKIYGQNYEVKCILEGNGGNGRALTDTNSAVSILGGELVDD